uniref:RNA-directed DNA polymerase, eukaryota, reverse transcriptase zinc-binding domain protein n=1 Tax=Tanacetum cinerariifolium TaxID=118510 RepID=A0A6L2MRL2_TANCI|nr:hypothetical protein [Tanacetum cinerariifolium]
MTSIQRKIKHRIRPPKRYEDSISPINKRNNNDLENSSDENSKDDMGKNELKTSSEQDFDTRDIGVNDNGRTDKYVERIIDDEENINIEEGDELRNDKECLDKEIKNGVEGSGSKNGVNGSVSADFTNGIGDILFSTVSPIDALSADKIDIPVGNIEIKLHQKNAPSTSANRNYANVAVNEELNKNLFSIPASIKENKDEVSSGGIDAKKRYKDSIEIQYKDKNDCLIRTKFMKVEYSWKPTTCSTCCVFGHSNSNCHKNGVNIDKQDEKKKYQRKQDEEGFIENIQYMYKPKDDAIKNQKKPEKAMQNNDDQFKTPSRMSNRSNEPHSKKIWNVRNKNVEELKKGAKRYAVLEDDKEGIERNDGIKDRRLEVDKFISEQRQPTSNDTKDWAFDMKEYFKCRWDELQRKKYVIESESDTDIECEVNEAAKNLNIKGMCTKDKQNEVRNFILDEHLTICGVLETHLKADSVCKIGKIIFRNWNWCANAQYSSNIGWNPLQNAFGVFHPIMISDHSPAVVTIPNGLKKKSKTFRFMNYIADKKEFIECVERECDQEIKGCNMYKKKAVKVLNEYIEASNDKLKPLQQKAKIKWLSEGDQNTAYFHGILKSRKYKGRIESICEENGNMYDGDKVVEAFVYHFKKFLGTKHDVKPLSYVDINFGKILSEGEANEMIRMVSDEEIKEVVFDIDSNKASGLDGSTFGFFKKHGILLAKRHMDIFKEEEGFADDGGILSFASQNIQSAGKFKYHYGCKDIQLSNMCFADDLLVLCNRDVESIRVVKKSMDQFSGISGLFPNLGKSTIFFRSVLIKIYWASVYMLPDATIKEVERLLKGFLWCQDPFTNGKAKVAWKVVCLPKDQGGLRIKDLKKWNEILLIKQLWKILEEKTLYGSNGPM